MSCKVIIATHGDLSKALLESAELIIGKNDGVCAIGLYPGTDPDLFKETLARMINEDPPHETLVLLDLLGGTPFNTIIGSLTSERVNFVTGVNLPMVLETVIQADECNLDILTQVAVQCGTDGIRCKSGVMGGMSNSNLNE